MLRKAIFRLASVTDSALSEIISPKAELFRDWGFAAARARAEALIEALPGSTFGKKTQARESLSRKDQENMIARSNRAFQASALNPTPPPPALRKVCPGGVLRVSPLSVSPRTQLRRRKG